MDPPETPTGGDKPVVKLSHPATPKTTTGSSGETTPSTLHQPSNSAADVGADKTSGVTELFNMDSPMKAYQILTQTPIRKSGQIRHQSQRNVAKIIKGEIHNVLSVMRADPRYYSTGSKGRCRFDYEEPQNYSSSALYGAKNRSSFWGGGNTDNWKADGEDYVYSGGNTISSHPILQGLRDLHDLLSVMEVEGSHQRGVSGNSSGAKCPLAAITAVTFVSPFAAAVKSRDVDAKTTGEALSALHKFIVYGFIGGNDASVTEYAESDHHLPFSSTNESVRESISLVAQCIRDCSLEDKSSRETASSKGMFSFRSSGEDVKPKSILAANNERTNGTGNELPSFLTQPRRKKKSTAGGVHSSSSAHSFSASDEDVILKLLSLSVQVLRCPAGRTLLPVNDVVTIFDACLHIAIAAGEANRTLLRSAAADALSHCVIVVFGARERTHARKDPSLSKMHAGSMRPDDSNAEDSDDDGWGERDPTTEDLAKESILVKQSPDKGSVTVDQEADDRQEDECATHELFEEPSLVPIMHRLAALADPLIHEDDTCILALSEINIALETMSDVDDLSVRYPRLLNVLQNDLCRNLLRLSGSSTNLTILGLSLRVIFNLFNGIKDHMKVQLEVFLTSVHLRILSFSTSPTGERTWSFPPEQRELALESMLEFCREPSLMSDLYTNYDCDINCTNLFETICCTLARVASPGDPSEEKAMEEGKDESDEGDLKPRLNILNRLALEGVLAVIEAIAARCRASKRFSPGGNVIPDDISDPTLPSPPDSGNSAFLGNTICLGGSESTTDDTDNLNGSTSAEYDLCSVPLTRSDKVTQRVMPPERCDSDAMSESENMEWLSRARHQTSLALRQRKIRKKRLAKAVAEFNERKKDKEWIKACEAIGMLPSPATPSSIAQFLYGSCTKLDLTKVGIYLSKGPSDKYPFNKEVLDSFASLFDFTGMTFSEALRSFLTRFRLPGEAQCIDRLMEAFANRLYEVQLAANNADENDRSVKNSMLDPPRPDDEESERSIRSGSQKMDPPAATDEERDLTFPFKSSDAAFILSFSTIMLNTDLHNPNMKDEKRMTLEQFLRNNRGINEGTDLPAEFLTDLYYEIRNKEIKMKQQDGGGGVDAIIDGFASRDVATPFFTPSHHIIIQAGVAERDMFVAISEDAIKAMATVFIESWDDVLVTKALDGMRDAAFISSFFGLNECFDTILELLLSFGLDYVGSISTLMHEPITVNPLANYPSGASELEAELASRNIPPLPESFLASLHLAVNSDANSLAGSAAHRGMLSLQGSLMLSKQHLCNVNEAWPSLLEVMFSLRDIDALPPRLSELDDFADSKGVALPPTPFSARSKHRFEEHIRPDLRVGDEPKSGGFFSFFGSGESPRQSNIVNSQARYPLSETLQRVAEDAQLDQIIMKTDDSAMAKRFLVAMLSAVFPVGVGVDGLVDDPTFEHNSVFVLELAARLLISNRKHSAVLYPLFLAKFQQIMSCNGGSDPPIGLRFPYLMERIVVTILRSAIHLFDVQEPLLREQLNRSLTLIINLPNSFTRQIGSRIGVGGAIILRGCFYLFDDFSQDDWSNIKVLLDLAAQDKPGRGFVFDGISSVIDSIEYATPCDQPEEALQMHGEEDSSSLQISQHGVEVMASLLLKFLNGGYENDLTFKVPSMKYIKKIYSFSRHFAGREIPTEGDGVETGTQLHDTEFETMVNAIYNDACLSNDVHTAKRGFESLQGVIVATDVATIPTAKWLAFLNMVVASPPSVSMQEARISYLALIGRLFLTLMPNLSDQRQNWTELEDFVIQVSSLVSENLNFGRASPLFETTVQTMTNVVNVMSMSGFHKGEGASFCTWVADTLFVELEKVGAGGGASLSSRP